MIVLTTSEICTKYRISESELARATRQLNAHTGEIFYTVTSRTGGPDHTVRATSYHDHRILTCCCKAGKAGSTCWAMRASVAASFLHRQNENLAYRAEAQAAAERIQAEAEVGPGYV